MEIVSPQVLLAITQQTPKPAAQFPSADPPLVVHSDLGIDLEAFVTACTGRSSYDVRQVPLRKDPASPVHTSFGN